MASDIAEARKERAKYTTERPSNFAYGQQLAFRSSLTPAFYLASRIQRFAEPLLEDRRS